MRILGDLAAFVASASAAALPGSERAILRRHMTDVVAARLAGGASAEGRAVAAFLPPGGTADGIAGLATLVRLTETDDIHTASGVTPSSVAVPAALGLAAIAPCSAERLESAIWVGLETSVRLGLAIGGAETLYQGLWPTRAAATLGAAAAACRVWGLSEAATRKALSMAVMLTAGRTGRYPGEPSGRWLVFAHAVSSGIRAAEGGRAGFSGDASVLDTDWLARSLGLAVDTARLVDGLGTRSVLGELSLKPYCTSRQALPGAEAMRALIAGGLDPATIEAFTIHVPAAYAGMISQKLDREVRASAYVSGAGMAAIAALDPAALWDIERTTALADPRIAALAAKGQVQADAALDPHYPMRWPARLEVRTRTGTLVQEMLEPLGAPGNPMDDRDLDDKVRRMLAHAGLADEAAPLLQLAAGAFDTDAGAAAIARCFASGEPRPRRA